MGKSEAPAASCASCEGGPSMAAETKRSIFHISNMDCPTEEALIRHKLGKMQGIEKLEFNLLGRMLTVDHTLGDTRAIREALQAVGMEAVEEKQAPSPAASDAGVARFHIENMDCPTEEALIRHKLGGIPGLNSLQFNLVQRTLTVAHALPTVAPILQALTQIGMNARHEAPVSGPGDAQPAKQGETAPQPTSWLPMAVSGLSALAAEAVEWGGGAHWITVALALVAIFTGGLPTYKKGWIALRNRNLNMNALMSIAVTGAMAIGQWPEAAMVMFLFALAEIIEAKSLDRARRAIRDLMDLAPETATVRQPDGSWADVEAKSVSVGMVARARPGERLALDGVIVSGRSTIDQAPITGESLPVEKAEGDAVFAGTVNQAGSFEFRVTALAGDSTLARIIHAVEAAQGSRAPTQRFVDKFARVYTPTVFAVAIAFAVIPPLLMGGAWLEWAYRALVLLVIACPCALVISTPVTIVSGLASAARHGILIKGGVYLEEARHLTILALDKTGTLTHGKPRETDLGSLPGEDLQRGRAIAASLAARSDHPVSLAIAKAASEAGLQPLEVIDFQALPGRGVEGRVEGRLYRLGNHRLIEESGLSNPAVAGLMDTYEREGKTVVYLASESAVLAFFAVADTLRDTSRQAIQDLHALGVTTILLTGDNAHTASAIAKQVGIDEARGNLLPEDKLRIVKELAQGGKVGMIGDGINDAPALAQADVGIAMGAAGTDTAIETADVALMDDDLRKVPALLRLSQSTAAILKQNIAVALGIKGVFIVLTVMGTATMWMAVFADMGASLLVVFNGLRLLRK